MKGHPCSRHATLIFRSIKVPLFVPSRLHWRHFPKRPLHILLFYPAPPPFCCISLSSPPLWFKERFQFGRIKTCRAGQLIFHLRCFSCPKQRGAPGRSSRAELAPIVLATHAICYNLSVCHFAALKYFITTCF